MNIFFMQSKKKFNIIYFALSLLITIGLQSPLQAINVSVNDIEEAFYLMIKYNDVKKIKKLNPSMVNLQAQDDFGYTPLHWACVHNAIDVAKLFILKGCNIHTKNNDDWSLLHTTAGNNSLELVKLLIQKGVNIENKDNFGKTPLNSAVCTHAIETVKFLIDAGADVNAQDNTHATPLLCLSVYLEPIELAQMLIDAGAHVNFTNDYGYSPLSMAVSFDSIEVAQLLIDKGAFVNSSSLLNDCKSKKMYNLITENDSLQKIIKSREGYQEFHSFSSKKAIRKFIILHTKKCNKKILS
ncbi:MAG: ankyrin repeat domain-containing protein [Candidatus Chromulinivorax sp.]|nr:ankyrin repeat domain-containing protein [Candidatus Chromulinivorax sp.]